MIVYCGCDSYFGNKRAAHYQDERYGHGNRACNPTSKEGVVRCTVCAKEHSTKKEKKSDKPEEKSGKKAA